MSLVRVQLPEPQISAGFRGFLFFTNLKLFPFSVPKYRQYLYYFYTRIHFGGIKTDFFVYTFLYGFYTPQKSDTSSTLFSE